MSMCRQFYCLIGGLRWFKKKYGRKADGRTRDGCFNAELLAGASQTRGTSKETNESENDISSVSLMYAAAKCSSDILSSKLFTWCNVDSFVFDFEFLAH